MEVCFYANLRPLVGADRVELELERGATVRSLLGELLRRWPALGEHLVTAEGELSRRVNLFVEGRNARWLQGEATPLDGVAQVDLFPPVAGG